MDTEIINSTIKALEKNNFEVFFVQNRDEAREVFFNEIFPRIPHACVSWGDSMTMKATGVPEAIEQRSDCVFIQTLGDNYTYDQKIYWRRKALEADLFLSGTNALTRQGQLVNVDMIGNRVAGMIFGPKNVVLFIGVNKITANIEEAIQRVRTVAAPQNAIRHTKMRTPCQKTNTCMNCQSPDRLCNTWVITEKSYPAKRIKIILINEPLGL